MKRAFLILSCLTLLLVSALFAWNATRSYPESTVQLPIAQYLPGGISDGPGRHPVRRSSESEGGWTYEDLPLGATESLDARAHEILGLTDFVYRRYTYVGASADGSSFDVPRSSLNENQEQRTKNEERIPKLPSALRVGQSFEIYIAYWAPGTMPARLMNGHTPDTCWVGSGWRITQRDNAFFIGQQVSRQIADSSRQLAVGSNFPNSAIASKEPPPTAHRHQSSIALAKEEPSTEFPAFQFLSHLPIPDLAALPGRWRIFEKNRTEIPVVFWHILEDEVYQYGHQSLWERLKRLVMDPFENGFDTRKEQWLVRVTL